MVRIQEVGVDDEQELSFRDLFELIRRGFLWALLAGIVVAAATYFISRSQPPIYQATATLILSQPSSDLNRFGVSLVSAPAIDVNAYREIGRASCRERRGESEGHGLVRR